MDLKQEGKKVIEAADGKLTSLTEIVTRKGWTKWAVLGALAFAVLVVVLLLWPGKSRATGYEHGGNLTAIGIGTGGAGGAGGSAAPVSVGGDSYSSRALGVGMAGLAASGNGCTESFSVAVVAGSWMTAVCKLAHELAVIESLPVSRAAKDQAKLNASCKYEFVASAVSECANRR